MIKSHRKSDKEPYKSKKLEKIMKKVAKSG